MTLPQDEQTTDERAPLDFEAEFGALSACADRAAVRVLGRGEDARDVTQEALARAYARWSDLAQGYNTHAWITRVSRNLAIEVLRRRRARPADIDLVEPASDIDTIDRVEFERALLDIAPRQREALQLRYVEDQTISDTALAMDCSFSSVRQSTQRGLKSLRSRLVAAGLIATLLIVGLAFAFLQRAGRSASQTVYIETPGRGFRVRVALSGSHIVSGGRLTAKVSVQNETDHSITLSGADASCAFAPVATLVAPNGSEAPTRCVPIGTTAPITLTPGETRDFAMPVVAVDANGAALAPGAYRVDVSGIGPGATRLPDVVHVDAPDHAAAAAASTNARGALDPSVLHDTSTPDATTLVGAGPSRPPAGISPVTSPPVTHRPPVTQGPPPTDPPPTKEPIAPPTPTATPFAIKVRSAQDVTGGGSAFGWRIEAKNTSDTAINATIVGDTISVRTPDGVDHQGIHESMPSIRLHAGPHRTATDTTRARFGAVDYIDGGIVASPPAPGTYVLTYIFDFADGSRSLPTTFTLLIR